MTAIATRLRRIGLPRLAVHLAVLLIVIIWLIPTLGILVTSIRDRDQITTSGWWTAFSSSVQTSAARLGDPSEQRQEAGAYVITGNVFAEGAAGTVRAFGTRVQEPAAFEAGEAAEIGEGETLTVNDDGSYVHSSSAPFEGSRGQRVYLSVATAPEFTMENYERVIAAEGLGQSFINSLTVTIPATIIPILIAAFAAYALSWMQFPGRALILAT
ncbi:MAG: carbohydrate ABC transporter permease, partial [Pseudorhizobium sp.]